MEWFLKLDTSVQVALLGLIGGIVAAIIGVIKEFWSKDEDEVFKHPRNHAGYVKLDEFDAAKIDSLITAIDNHADAIERHRVQLSLKK